MTRTKRSIWVFSVIAVLSSLAVLPRIATAESARLADGAFNETYRSVANTGGARVMGLQMTGADVPDELRALLPQDWSGKPFCVRTSSSDGLYSSENTYIAPDQTIATVQIPHVTLSSHSDRFPQFNQQNFGIRILQNGCDTQNDEAETAIALWQSGRPVDSFDIYVNGFGAQRLVAVVRVDGAKIDPIECEFIKADVRVAFDRICSVPISKDAATVSATLIPFKGGVRGRSEKLDIVLK